MFLKVEDLPKDIGIQRQLTNMHVKEWLQEDVFHFRWWLLIALMIIFLLIWWMMLDKSRIHEICLFSALAVIFVMGINEYGEELTLWDYHVDLIPIFPPLSSINLVSLPLIFSLVYQHFKKKKSFILAAIITSAVICFVFEPILSWGGFFQLLHWKYYFSLPIYAVMAISVRAIVFKINAVTGKNSKLS
jgi:hypothetical protein